MRRGKKIGAFQIVTPPKESVRQFHRVIEQYFEESFQRFPSHASHLGRREFNGELERATANTYLDQLRLVERTRAEVENLPARHFSADAWLDRRALLSELR